MTLVQLFLIHRYKASSVHYLTPTEDNAMQTQRMKGLGIFTERAHGNRSDDRRRRQQGARRRAASAGSDGARGADPQDARAGRFGALTRVGAVLGQRIVTSRYVRIWPSVTARRNSLTGSRTVARRTRAFGGSNDTPRL